MYTPQCPHLFNTTTYETTHLLLHVLICLQCQKCVCVFVCVLAILFQLLSSICALEITEITEPPQNSVALAGSPVHLTCGIVEDYAGYFEWRAFIAGELGGDQIYSSPPFHASSPRFHQQGKYGLEINPVEWRDAGKYTCSFLTGDVRASANIVVMGQFT